MEPIHSRIADILDREVVRFHQKSLRAFLLSCEGKIVSFIPFTQIVTLSTVKDRVRSN
jgi:hypothetical protein